MSTLITNLNDLIAHAAGSYLSGNVETFKSDVPGPQGVQGPTGLQGVKGDKGDKGEDLVLEQVIYKGNGVFEWHFSDESVYTTPSLMGPQGATGAQGLKGDQGISVHHLKPTSTTNVHGDFRVAGEDDTYTFYGDAEETINLGFFVVHNGEDGQDAYEVALERGYVGTSEQFYSDIMYNAINISVIDDYASSANSSRVAAEAARDVAVEARDEAVLAKDILLAQKGQVNGIASLDSGGKIPSSQLPSYVDDVIEVATSVQLALEELQVDLDSLLVVTEW